MEHNCKINSKCSETIEIDKVYFCYYDYKYSTYISQYEPVSNKFVNVVLYENHVCYNAFTN